MSGAQKTGDEGVRLLYELTKEELVKIIVDDAKNCLAHDGLWFQEVERRYGMDAAVAVDIEAWRKFTVIEAKRIMSRLKLEPGQGIPALVECLKHRFYARINLQEAIEVTDNRAVFRMLDCRVQSARRRKGMAEHPCKSVGIVEYGEFARTIDPRIVTRCIACPPDPVPDEFWCAWEFTLQD
jgi:hypothetical protein